MSVATAEVNRDRKHNRQSAPLLNQVFRDRVGRSFGRPRKFEAARLVHFC